MLQFVLNTAFLFPNYVLSTVLLSFVGQNVLIVVRVCILYCMCVPLSAPRLPVASYKNSFSMTEWRIRLEGNDQ